MVANLMKYIFWIRHLFLLFLLFTASAFANPYQGVVPVLEHNEETLKELALKQVLVKVSGSVAVIDLNDSKALLKKADKLISQYGYQTHNGRPYFEAVFDKFQIDKSLKGMHQRIWGDTRPTTLIWLVSNDGSDRNFISDNLLSQSVNNKMSTVFQDQQHNRGISLQFPLIDLEDNLVLSVSDVEGRFYDQIAEASERYDVEHFVAANLIQKNSGNWSLSWELVKANFSGRTTEVLASNTVSGIKTSLLSSMIDEIADFYADKYAILENQGNHFYQTIHIHGINSLKQFTQLNNILNKLVSVSNYEVASVEGSEVIIDIKISGGFGRFKNELYAQPNLESDPSLREAFHFNWQ